MTDAEGNYTILMPDANGNWTYTFDLHKDGYVRTGQSNDVQPPLKTHKKTQHNMTLGKVSYLKITVKKTPDPTLNSTLKLFIIYNTNERSAEIGGRPSYEETEEIQVDASKAETDILYTFYYRETSRVNLKWEVTQETDSRVKTYFSDIYLTEYGTTEFEINY